MRLPILFITGVCAALLYSGTGSALEPREIFKAVDPSVVVVLASDAKGEKNNLGSGVIVSPQEIVTSCKVVESAADIVVSQGSALRKATLRFNDAERDLCQLHIEDPLPAGKPAAVAPSTPAIETGQDVYAVGAPRGMEHAISRAMVSSVREVGSSKSRLIQIDVPLTGGLIGSGVFDQNGRLIGIAAGKFRQGDSASYAVPIDWLAEFTQRNPDLLLNPIKAPQAAVVTTPAAEAKPDWWPHVGDHWKYRVSLAKQYVGSVNVEIVDVNGKMVQERITYDGSKGFVKERGVEVGFNPVRFQPPAALPGGYQLVDLAPYSDPGTPFRSGQRWNDIAGAFAPQGGSNTQNANSKVTVIANESVRVPAGQFKAWKVETVSDQLYAVNQFFVARCTYWYAPEIKRTVKMILYYKANLDAISSIQTFELESFEEGK